MLTSTLGNSNERLITEVGKVRDVNVLNKGEFKYLTMTNSQVFVLVPLK